MLCNVSLNTSIACSLVCIPGMTSSLAKVNKSSGAHFLALVLKFPNFSMFLNIRIHLLILKTYDGQFTLTTKKSLHIIFKHVTTNVLRAAMEIRTWPSRPNVSCSRLHKMLWAEWNKCIEVLLHYLTKVSIQGIQIAKFQHDSHLTQFIPVCTADVA